MSKIEVPALKKNTIEFLNWFAEYNMIPKGMALKLLLLSNNAIEKFPDKNYEKFKNLIVFTFNEGIFNFLITFLTEKFLLEFFSN